MKRLLDGDRRASAALVSLGGDDLVVKRAKVHTQVPPCVEVITSRDRSTGAFALPDTPELRKRLCALDRGSVGTGGGQNVVGRAVRVDGALLGRTSRRVVRAVALDDVVLDERARRPAVHGEVAIAIGIVVGGVLDVPKGAVSSSPSVERKRRYLAEPGFQPLPPTQFPA